MMDFHDIKGQAMPKRALEVAAVGGHSILLFGPHGTGKTMLIDAARPLSVDGVGARGFDGIPEPRLAKQFFEVSEIHELWLMAECLSCPCGRAADGLDDYCQCMSDRRREWERMKQKFREAFAPYLAMAVEVPRLRHDEMMGKPLGEFTEGIAARVTKARAGRFRANGSKGGESGDGGETLNANQSDEWVSRHCLLPPDCASLMRAAIDQMKLDARQVTMLLKVARTITDMSGDFGDRIGIAALAEACQYRSGINKFAKPLEAKK